MMKLKKLALIAMTIITCSAISFAAPGNGRGDRRPNITIDNRPQRPVAPRPNAQVRPSRPRPNMSDKPRRKDDKRYERRPVYYSDYYYQPYPRHYRRPRRRYAAVYPYVNVGVGFPIARHVFGNISIGF